MNYTEQQIKLAGLLQPDGGSRDFGQDLEFQGEGIRSLGSNNAIFEVNTGDCCDDLSTCEAEKFVLLAENAELTTENEELTAENEELQEQARFVGTTITLNGLALDSNDPDPFQAKITATITLDSVVYVGSGNYTYSFSYTFTTTKDDNGLPAFRTASILRQGAQVVCVQIPNGGGSGSGTHQTTQSRQTQIEWTAHASYTSNCRGAFGSGYEEKGFVLTGL